jgi:hypothetical protein
MAFITILKKGLHYKNKKMPRKQQIKKKPSSDDFGRISV